MQLIAFDARQPSLIRSLKKRSRAKARRDSIPRVFAYTELFYEEKYEALAAAG